MLPLQSLHFINDALCICQFVHRCPVTNYEVLLAIALYTTSWWMLHKGNISQLHKTPAILRPNGYRSDPICNILALYYLR